jgi:DNA invertase Pin-like site-specific DNA recombinase
LPPTTIESEEIGILKIRKGKILGQHLKAHGVGFASLTEQIDTRSPSGQLVFHIFGALAEFERNLIRERTLAGLKAARARGRNGGRPKKLNPKDLKTIRTLVLCCAQTKCPCKISPRSLG